MTKTHTIHKSPTSLNFRSTFTDPHFYAFTSLQNAAERNLQTNQRIIPKIPPKDKTSTPHCSENNTRQPSFLSKPYTHLTPQNKASPNTERPSTWLNKRPTPSTLHLLTGLHTLLFSKTPLPHPTSPPTSSHTIPSISLGFILTPHILSHHSMPDKSPT